MTEDKRQEDAVPNGEGPEGPKTVRPSIGPEIELSEPEDSELEGSDTDWLSSVIPPAPSAGKGAISRGEAHGARETVRPSIGPEIELSEPEDSELEGSDTDWLSSVIPPAPSAGNDRVQVGQPPPERASVVPEPEPEPEPEIEVGELTENDLKELLKVRPDALSDRLPKEAFSRTDQETLPFSPLSDTDYESVAAEEPSPPITDDGYARVGALDDLIKEMENEDDAFYARFDSSNKAHRSDLDSQPFAAEQAREEITGAQEPRTSEKSPLPGPVSLVPGERDPSSVSGEVPADFNQVAAEQEESSGLLAIKENSETAAFLDGSVSQVMRLSNAPLGLAQGPETLEGAASHKLTPRPVEEPARLDQPQRPVAAAALQDELRDMGRAAGLADSLERLFARSFDKAPREWISADRSIAGQPSERPYTQSLTPLVGVGPKVDRLRGDLIEHVAARVSGPDRCRALTAAGELYQLTGELDRADTLYQAALQADREDLVALRNARQSAIIRGQWESAAALLNAEAALPLGPQERAAVLTLLSEICFRQLGELQSAQQAAEAALQADPKAVVPGLILAEIYLAERRPALAAESVRVLIGNWADRAMRDALLKQAGTWLELSGDAAGAKTFYERELGEATDGPKSLETALHLARVARGSGDIEGAIAALIKLSRWIEPGLLQDELLRSAARYAFLSAGRPRQAIELLAQDRGIAGLALRARAAELAGDQQCLRETLEALVQVAQGSEQALALIELAQVYAAGKDYQSAMEALHNAAEADATLETVRIVREMVARGAGDTLQLARSVESIEQGGALVAAAKLVRSGPDQTVQERFLLENAAGQEQVSFTADTLALDAAAAAGDTRAVQTLLQREAERLALPERVGPLLALLDLVYQGLPADTYSHIAQEALDALPGSPLVLRQLARDALKGPEANFSLAASYWLEEASACTGWRAAFAATEAGRLFTAAQQDPTSAFRGALEAVPGYGPAYWAMENYARATGNRELLLFVHEQLAQVLTDPLDQAIRLVNAAQIKADIDPAGAAALIQRSLQLQPRDVVAMDLLCGLNVDVPVDYLAKQLEIGATDQSAGLVRMAWMRAASMYENAGEPLRAAEFYRRVLQASDGVDTFAQWGLEQAEGVAGRYAFRTDRILKEIRNAPDEEARAMALQRLAELEEARGDKASAVVALESLLQITPGNLIALRKLERYFSEQGREDDLLRIAEALFEHLRDPAETAAYLRLAVRLRERLSEADIAAADSVVLKGVGRAKLDFWLAQRQEAAARRAGDPRLVAQVLGDSLACLTDPMEKAAVAVRAADAIEHVAPEVASALLVNAVEIAPNHPTASEALGRVRELLNDRLGAAEAYEIAAKAANNQERIRRLWYRAATIWQDEIGDKERALKALNRLVNADVLYRDAFARTRALLEEIGDGIGLRELLRVRLEAPGEEAELCALNRELARLCLELGDRNGAKGALRAALTFQPQNAEALRALCEMLLEDQQWHETAEILIRLTVLIKEPEQQRWLLMHLGDIYDRYLPNLERAEIAFSRVVKLQADHVEAIERLADIYRRQNQQVKQVRALQRLLELAQDSERWKKYTLLLAEAFEQLGQPRDAERTFEACQQKFPTELAVTIAFADFYRRQGADSALAVHLNRAANEFRGIVQQDATRLDSWLGLIEVLSRRGYIHAAQACASAAHAIGLTDPKVAALVDARGATLMRSNAVNDAKLDRLIAPPGLWDATRWVLQRAAPALEKVLPFDPKGYGAERLRATPKPVAQILGTLSEWFGIKEIVLYIHRSRICMPISIDPLAIVVGRDLLEQTDETEKLFMFTRAAKIGASNLAVVVRSQRPELLFSINALIRHYDRTFEPKGVDLAGLDEIARRIGKAIPRGYHDELGPSVFEMKGMPDYNPAKLPELVYDFASRIALVATGSTSAALTALIKVSEPQADLTAPDSRFSAIRRHPEASALFDFAISDALFSARQKLANADHPK